MKIGDLFFGVSLDDSKLGPQATAAGKKAGTAAGAGAAAGMKSSMGGLGKSLLAGVGIGAGFALLDTAISSTINFLGDATAAAKDEEAGMAKLEQSLRANVAGWNGNTDAIEAAIDAREKLGFSDGEQRDSLARLVSVTKDHNTALDLQRQAMDLARLRGIDLGTASDIIGKVFAGNVGILGRYGIQLEKGATSTEALAEIQRRAAGQAEAFGNTSEGAAAKAAIEFENLQEDIGGVLLPILQDLARFGSEVLIPFIREVVGGIKQWVTDNQPLLQTIGQIVGVLAGVGMTVLTTWYQALLNIAGAIGEVIKFLQPLIDLIIQLGSAVFSALGPVADVFGRMAGAFIDLVRKIIGGAATIISAILGIPGKVASWVGSMIGQGARLVEGIVSRVGAMVTSVVGAILSIPQKAIAWVQNLINTAQRAAAGFVATVIRFVSNVVTTILGIPGKIVGGLADGFRNAARRAVDAFLGLIRGIPGKVADILGGVGDFIGGIIPKFATGALEIPRDMLAVVHKGEMIIPAREADAIRQGRTGLGQQVMQPSASVTNNSVQLQTYGLPMQAATPSEVVREIRRAVRLGVIVPRQPAKSFR